MPHDPAQPFKMKEAEVKSQFPRAVKLSLLRPEQRQTEHAQPAIWRYPRAGKGYVRLGERSGKPQPSAWGKTERLLGI